MKRSMQILAATLFVAAPAMAFAQENTTTYPEGFDCSTLTGTDKTNCETQMNNSGSSTMKPNNSSGQGADPSDPNTDTNSSNIQPDANGATNSGSTN